MDVIHALSARYCARQDARGFIELWLVSVALAAGVVAIAQSMRRGAADRARQGSAVFGCAVLACLIVLTGGFALTIFRWCYESAASSLGMVPSNPPAGLDAMICLSSHALGMINGWMVIVVSCVAATGLVVLGGLLKGTLRRALSYAGAAVAGLFAAANGGLMLFSASWCQSSRLF